MNKLILIGNLTADPQLRTTQDGTSVCNFTIAVNGRRNGDTQYFRIAVWRKLGEVCAQYLRKGRKVYVSGPVSYSTYKDSRGETRVNLDVTADDVEFLSPRDTGDDPGSAIPAGFEQVETTELPF